VPQQEIVQSNTAVLEYPKHYQDDQCEPELSGRLRGKIQQRALFWSLDLNRKNQPNASEQYRHFHNTVKPENEQPVCRTRFQSPKSGSKGRDPEGRQDELRSASSKNLKDANPSAEVIGEPCD
jgi:hypothetical protein